MSKETHKKVGDFVFFVSLNISLKVFNSGIVCNSYLYKFHLIPLEVTKHWKKYYVSNILLSKVIAMKPKGGKVAF